MIDSRRETTNGSLQVSNEIARGILGCQGCVLVVTKEAGQQCLGLAGQHIEAGARLA
jgi:hypothetical protein